MKLQRHLMYLAFIVGFLVTSNFALSGDLEATGAKKKQVEHGRYIVTIAGCNDCHTSGYLLNEGNVPEQQWLLGDSLGWRGPWGTTYPTNLRLLIPKLSEEQWLNLARHLKARPTMPWFNLRKMTDSDLRAVYQFFTHLGPAGEPAPDYVPPDKEPATPYVMFPSPPPK